MDSITSDWKHLLRTETSQKSLLKIFCYNNKVTWKVKDSQKLSILYKRIHFFLPLNPAIHRMGGQHTKYSVPQMQRTKIVSTLFYIVLQTFQTRIILDFISELINLTHTQLSRDTASGSRETFLKAWSSLLNINANLNILFSQFSQIS